jgi:hypothetical protein
MYCVCNPILVNKGQTSVKSNNVLKKIIFSVYRFTGKNKRGQVYKIHFSAATHFYNSISNVFFDSPILEPILERVLKKNELIFFLIQHTSCFPP